MFVFDLHLCIYITRRYSVVQEMLHFTGADLGQAQIFVEYIKEGKYVVVTTDVTHQQSNFTRVTAVDCSDAESVTIRL